jgi:hypothetical protein
MKTNQNKPLMFNTEREQTIAINIVGFIALSFIGIAVYCLLQF